MLPFASMLNPRSAKTDAAPREATVAECDVWGPCFQWVGQTGQEYPIVQHRWQREDCLVIANIGDAHHIVLTREQARALGKILTDYARSEYWKEEWGSFGVWEEIAEANADAVEDEA